jgi:hypothetical protein
MRDICYLPDEENPEQLRCYIPVSFKEAATLVGLVEREFNRVVAELPIHVEAACIPGGPDWLEEQASVSASRAARLAHLLEVLK